MPSLSKATIERFRSPSSTISEKNKKTIMWVSIAVAVILLCWFGYKWYESSQAKHTLYYF